MNNLKTKISIKDLENLTGSKAHTIRIWEKRYNLLEHKRTETNIRYYDLASFQKLLNVSYLNNNGHKISKIATLKSDEIPKLVREIALGSNLESHAVNSFKLSMVNFDQALFYSTYEALLKDKSFEIIFYEIFITHSVGTLERGMFEHYEYTFKAYTFKLGGSIKGHLI